MIDLSSLALLKGKKALVTGIANDQSIAWGCAKAFHAFGADVAITYLNDKTRTYVEPLAKEIGSPIFMPLDLQRDGELEAVFNSIEKKWGKLDLCLHSSVRTQRGFAGSRRRLLKGGVPSGDGDFVLVFHPDGETCRAFNEVRRGLVHDDLLRFADGR